MILAGIRGGGSQEGGLSRMSVMSDEAQFQMSSVGRRWLVMRSFIDFKLQGNVYGYACLWGRSNYRRNSFKYFIFSLLVYVAIQGRFHP